VQHSFGWPLDNSTGGGSFLYHFDDNLVAVGFVVHLNYQNPTLSPFDEFQRFKTHPLVRPTFEGGKRISYGARAITEGGWQSVPNVAFPGGALIGCSAGFVNVPRIKGSHNAILSGMMAAEHACDAITQGRSNDVLAGYEKTWRDSAIGRDLKKVRNAKPLWSRYGTAVGVALGGVDMWTNDLFGFSLFGTLGHGKPDHATLKPIDQVKPIVYPKPDGVVSFDKLSSVFLSATNHEEDQPAHLKLADPSIPVGKNLPLYGEPARLYCPAGVYEVVYADAQAKTDPPLRDQRAELRALQDVRHQGPRPEHHLGDSGGWRGPELPEHVTPEAGPGHCGRKVGHRDELSPDLARSPQKRHVAGTIQR
jgi:electron-transferring-flavoprotein dehydrogenase